MLRRLYSVFGLFLVITNVSLVAQAQSYAPYYRLRMLRFNVEWDGNRDQQDPNKYSGILKWELDKQHPDPGVYHIKFRGTEQHGVYYVIRLFPDRSYEIFGQGETLVNESKKAGLNIVLAPDTDLAKPYVIKRAKDEYRVFNHIETTELIKLFDTLNQWLFLRVIPKATGQPFEHKLFQKTELEMGNAITFKRNKEWSWGKMTDDPVRATKP